MNETKNDVTNRLSQKIRKRIYCNLNSYRKSSMNYNQTKSAYLFDRVTGSVLPEEMVNAID